jgi:hypothetical protein
MCCKLIFSTSQLNSFLDKVEICFMVAISIFATERNGDYLRFKKRFTNEGLCEIKEVINCSYR